MQQAQSEVTSVDPTLGGGEPAEGSASGARSEPNPEPAVEPGAASGAGSGGEPGEARGVLPYPLKRLGPARQVVIVTSRSWTGTQARLEAYEDGEHGWHPVLGPVDARVGRTGMVAEERRLAASGTTPAGTFTLSQAFGLRPDPGARLPYHHVTAADEWWVADPASPHFNRLRQESEGGFRAREGGRTGSIQIAAHPDRYAYAIVVDFNRPYPDRSRGGAIFLRVSCGLSTDGSVAVDEGTLEELLRWLDPDKRPVITVAPERVVGQY